MRDGAARLARRATGIWHVFRHADVEAITRDPATFSSDTGPARPRGAPVRRGMLTQIDPPEHRALRRLVSAAFTPRTVAGLEPRIRGRHPASCSTARASGSTSSTRWRSRCR